MLRLEPFLCGWYLYMLVLAGLMLLSSGRRTRRGYVAGFACLCILVLMASLWLSFDAYFIAIGPYPSVDLFRLLPKLVILAISADTALRADRQDTRLIALLLLAATALPLALDFCGFGEKGFTCKPPQ